MSQAGFEPGSLVAGKYKIERELAAGGMGKVYTAVQHPVNRRVVLKLMHAELVAKQEMRERFLREAEAAGRLSHPNTVTIFDYGTTPDGVCFIAMEYIEGEPLQNLIERKGALPLEQAVQIAIQVANSLGEAHRKNIIHRDLKPDNIMVGTINQGELIAKVLDFGIAKVLDSGELTAAGTIFGTPSYMAPEQGRNQKLDGRADLYALGCCFYAMLTAQTPYRDDTSIGLIMAHINAPIPHLPPHLPAALDAFIQRALAKDPVNRPATAEAFIAELRAAVEGIQGLHLPPVSADETASFSTGSLPASAISTGQGPSSTPQPAPGTVHLSQGLSSGGTIVVHAPPANNTMQLVVVGLLVLILAGGAYVIFKPSDSAESASPKPPPAAPSLVKLTLNSDPPGATVLINGKPVGPTPHAYEGQPGDKLKVTFKKPAFQDETADLTLDPGMQNQYFAKLKRRRLVLRVTSPLPRGMLTVAGTSIGTMLEHKTFSDEVDWPEQELLLSIRSDTHEDLILKLSPVALERAVEDNEFEWEPDLSDFVPKVTP